MNQQLNQSVIKATEDIFQSMLGLQVQPGSPEEKPINEGTEETNVLISVMGEVSGAFTLKCSTQTATYLTGKMLGTEDEIDMEEIKDAAGELLNMIVGSAMTSYSVSGSTKMSVPTTIIGEDYSVHIKADPDDTVSFIPFKADEADLAIDVFVK